MIWARIISRNELIIAAIFYLVVTLLFLIFIPMSEADSLQWDPVSNAGGYTIYYQDTTIGKDEILKTAQTTISMTQLSLYPGHDYTFEVIAYNLAGESDRSNSVTYTAQGYTPPDDTVPVVISIPGPATILILQE